jgi:hypothetical protein
VYPPHDVVQFSLYCSTPLLLILQPIHTNGSNVTLGHLPIKAYEPMIEIRDGSSRSLYVEAPFNVETGEAERIAVDTTARGGEGGTSRTSTLPSIGLFCTLLSSRISSPNATSCCQNATRSNPGPCELCQGRSLRDVLFPLPSPHATLILVQSQALHQKITLPYGPWLLWWLHSQLATARVSEMSLKLCQYFHPSRVFPN